MLNQTKVGVEVKLALCISFFKQGHHGMERKIQILPRIEARGLEDPAV